MISGSVPEPMQGFHDGVMSVFNAVLREALKITGIHC